MRLVYWNIERGYHPYKITQLLKDLKADIYLLSEVDRGVRRTKQIDMFALLQKELQLDGMFAMEYEELQSWLRIFSFTGGRGGGHHGNAIFSRLPIDNYHVIPLPKNKKLSLPGKTFLHPVFEPKHGTQLAQIFEIRVKNTKITIANTHLADLRATWSHRKYQLQTLIQHLPSKNSILAGDLNSLTGIIKANKLFKGVPGEVEWVRNFLTQHGFNPNFDNRDYTYDDYFVRAKLDWIATTKEIHITDRQNIATQLSDHHCLVVDVDVKS